LFPNISTFPYFQMINEQKSVEIAIFTPMVEHTVSCFTVRHIQTNCSECMYHFALKA